MFGLFRKPRQVDLPGVGTFIKHKKNRWKLAIRFKASGQTVSCAVMSEPGLSKAALIPAQRDITIIKHFFNHQNDIEQDVEASLVQEYQAYRDTSLQNFGTRNVFTDEVMDENSLLPEIEGHAVWRQVSLLSMQVCSEKISEWDSRIEIQIMYQWVWDYEHQYAISIGDNKVIRIDDC